MGRKLRGIDHGAHRLVVTKRSVETGEVVSTSSEGPYATLAAARGRVVWAKRDAEWWVKRGKFTVEIEVQSIENPQWATVTKEVLD